MHELVTGHHLCVSAHVPTFPLPCSLVLQDRLHNPALTVFWDCWWPLVFVSYPFLGRVWCAVCPFMIYGELAQAWRTSGGAQLLKWPREQGEAAREVQRCVQQRTVAWCTARAARRGPRGRIPTAPCCPHGNDQCTVELLV